MSISKTNISHMHVSLYSHNVKFPLKESTDDRIKITIRNRILISGLLSNTFRSIKTFQSLLYSQFIKICSKIQNFSTCERLYLNLTLKFMKNRALK